MAKRKSLNRRSGRFSRSGLQLSLLNQDSNVFEDDSLWYQNLEDETVVRPSRSFNCNNETTRCLKEGSTVNMSEMSKHWHEDLNESISKKINLSKQIKVDISKEESNYTIETSSESEEEFKSKKKKFTLRSKTNKSDHNVFLEVLDDSQMSFNNEKEKSARSIHDSTHEPYSSHQVSLDTLQEHSMLKQKGNKNRKSLFFRHAPKKKELNAFDMALRGSTDSHRTNSMQLNLSPSKLSIGSQLISNIDNNTVNENKLSNTQSVASTSSQRTTSNTTRHSQQKQSNANLNIQKVVNKSNSLISASKNISIEDSMNQQKINDRMLPGDQSRSKINNDIEDDIIPTDSVLQDSKIFSSTRRSNFFSNDLDDNFRNKKISRSSINKTINSKNHSISRHRKSTDSSSDSDNNVLPPFYDLQRKNLIETLSKSLQSLTGKANSTSQSVHKQIEPESLRQRTVLTNDSTTNLIIPRPLMESDNSHETGMILHKTGLQGNMISEHSFTNHLKYPTARPSLNSIRSSLNESSKIIDNKSGQQLISTNNVRTENIRSSRKSGNSSDVSYTDESRHSDKSNPIRNHSQNINKYEANTNANKSLRKDLKYPAATSSLNSIRSSRDESSKIKDNKKEQQLFSTNTDRTENIRSSRYSGNSSDVSYTDESRHSDKSNAIRNHSQKINKYEANMNADKSSYEAPDKSADSDISFESEEKNDVIKEAYRELRRVQESDDDESNTTYIDCPEIVDEENQNRNSVMKLLRVEQSLKALSKSIHSSKNTSIDNRTNKSYFHTSPTDPEFTKSNRSTQSQKNITIDKIATRVEKRNSINSSVDNTIVQSPKQYSRSPRTNLNVSIPGSSKDTSDIVPREKSLNEKSVRKILITENSEANADIEIAADDSKSQAANFSVENDYKNISNSKFERKTSNRKSLRKSLIDADSRTNTNIETTVDNSKSLEDITEQNDPKNTFKNVTSNQSISEKRLSKKPETSELKGLLKYNFIKKKMAEEASKENDTLLKFSQETTSTLSNPRDIANLEKKLVAVRTTLKKMEKAAEIIELKEEEKINSKIKANKNKKLSSLNKSKNKNSTKRVKDVDPAYLVNGKVYKAPRLPRPKPWATDRLYKYLINRLEPKYHLMARVKSEKFILQLAEIVSVVTRRKKYDNYKVELNALIKQMAYLGIINCRKDFHEFCFEFLPYEFRIKAVPMLLPGNVQNIPFDPQNLYTPILQS